MTGSKLSNLLELDYITFKFEINFNPISQYVIVNCLKINPNYKAINQALASTNRLQVKSHIYCKKDYVARNCYSDGVKVSY